VASAARGGQGIHGTAALRTAPIAGAPAVARAEALAPGEMRRVPVEGELLGAARVRARFATLPLDAFDRAGALLEPEEQGAYFQLLRLSYGEGRNFCRAAKRDLMSRLGASERRLVRILDGLVRKGFARPLHRDNRGTLFRVFLPREVSGEPLGEEVLLGRAAANEALPAPPAVVRPMRRERAAPVRGAVGAVGAAAPAARLGAALADARGDAGADALAAASDEVRELLADGATPRQVEAAIRAIARRQARPNEGGTP
jgi:hypothetical protein